MDQWDVVIAGAGIAGLTAAERLGKAGLKVLVLEARDRVGGRILTLLDIIPDYAIELGAEFVHGKPKEFDQYLQRRGVEMYETDGQSYCSEEDELNPCDGPDFEVFEKLYRMDLSAFPDETFEETLQSRFASAPSRATDWARRYVQGFHAADTSRISTHSIITDGRAEEQTEGDRGFHVRGGYSKVLDAICQELPPTVQVRTNAIVESIHWSGGRVWIATRSSAGSSMKFVSSKLVVTLPLGVLQQKNSALGAVLFDPPLLEKDEALNSMVMGHVNRLVLQFDELFWEQAGALVRKPLRDLHFLFGRDQAFPTFWTAMPIRAPVLVAWAAGPVAHPESTHSQQQLESQAMSSLAHILQVSEDLIRQRFVRSYYHDWQNDPFSRGAYSYVLAGGVAAQKRLAAPVQNTIFFAGEATQSDGHRATVHGAFASGLRAAEEILATLRS